MVYVLVTFRYTVLPRIHLTPYYSTLTTSNLTCADIFKLWTAVNWETKTR